MGLDLSLGLDFVTLAPDVVTLGLDFVTGSVVGAGFLSLGGVLGARLCHQGGVGDVGTNLIKLTHAFFRILAAYWRCEPKTLRWREACKI